MTLLNRLYFPSAILGIYLISLLIQTLLFLNWDVASLLHATTVLLAGGQYVTDIFTPNPPMILYLYIPPVIFAKFFSSDMTIVYRCYVYLLCTLSAISCYVLIKPSNIFMATLLAVYLILPTYEFGNRDHLIFILVMPYLLAIVTQLQGNKLSTKSALWVGLLAGVGFAIKPQYLITFALIELYFMYQQKRASAALRAESLVIAFILLCYAVTTIIFHQQYLTAIVPFLLRNYYSTIGIPAAVLTKYPLMVFCYMTCALTLCWQLFKEKNPLFSVLLIALAGFMVGAYLQHSLFYAHFIPALSIACLLSVMIIYLFASSETISPSIVITITLLATIFTIIDIRLYQYAWHNIIFNPWFFYGFFAVVFALLLYASKIKLNTLSIIIYVAAIITTGVFCSRLTTATDYFAHDFLFTLLAMSTLFILLSRARQYSYMHSLLNVTLVISMFYVPVMQVYHRYMEPREYKEKFLNNLITFINENGTNPSIYTISTLVQYTFPVTYYTKATSAQRFDQLWPLLTFAKTNYPEKDKTFFMEMVAEDLHKNQPDLVFVEDGRLLNEQIDYLAFLSDNPTFRNEWKSYRYLASLPLGSINHTSTAITVYQRIH